MENEHQITAASTLKADTAQKPCVYLLVNLDNGAIYTGITPTLIEQVRKHKNHMVEGFSKRFDITALVWYEPHETIESACQRAKSLKNSPFNIKQALVEQKNPKWQDLYSDLCAEQQEPALQTG